MRALNALVLLPLLAAPALGAAQRTPAASAQGDAVATAGGLTLSVADAAGLIAANPQVPADSNTVRALAERWVDYALLAAARVQDTTFAALDVDRLVQPQREEQTLNTLMQRAVRVDTALTDAQLAQGWAQYGPGEEIHARHILLIVPQDATPALRDSIRRQAESVRAQAAAPGADFAALATRYSQDPGSKDRGGELDWFGRGQMVPAFEHAAFALQAGQVSPLVETPFGWHVIKVEGRRTREIGTDKEPFRRFLVQRAQQEAARRFVDSLSTAGRLAVDPGAPALMREIVRNPAASSTGAAAARVLATFAGGQLTAGDLAATAAGAPPQALEQAAAAPDSALREMLEQQAQRKLLLAEAVKRGINPTAQETQQLRDQARQAIRQVAAQTGIGTLHAPAGAAGRAQVAQHLLTLLRQAVAGERQLPPLGTLGTQLRARYGGSVNLSAVPRVIERVRSLRPATTPSASPAPRD